jgi:uncharacterized protein YggE
MECSPYIEVTGSAQIVTTPDEINLQIILREYYDGSFKISIAEQEAKMKNMLKIAGVDITKLTLANINEDYITITKRKKEVNDEKRYYLTVSTVPILVSALQVFNDLNIKDVKIISVVYSNVDGLRQKAKIKAIQDAKEKAGLLVSAIGNKLGKPLLIKEEYFSSNDTDEEIKEDDFVLEFRKIIIQSRILARFGIE